jgi:hypothetical protein
MTSGMTNNPSLVAACPRIWRSTSVWERKRSSRAYHTRALWCCFIKLFDNVTYSSPCLRFFLKKRWSTRHATGLCFSRQTQPGWIPALPFADIPKCICPPINTFGTGRNATNCTNITPGRNCSMTCNGALNRTRTVDGLLQCQLSGLYRQVTPGPQVPDMNKACLPQPPLYGPCLVCFSHSPHPRYGLCLDRFSHSPHPRYGLCCKGCMLLA